MKLTNAEKAFLRKNEEIISKILIKRREDLKEQLLETPEAKRSVAIGIINEFKIAIGILREVAGASDKKKGIKEDDFTGI